MKKLSVYCLFISIFVAPPLRARQLTESDLHRIVDELTTTAARQQRALDELARSEEQLLPFLPLYFYDKRKIADSNVRFLNTSPKVFEKYFLTGGETVDVVIIQYFCYRTAKCVPTDDPVELEKIRKRFSKPDN